MSSKESTGDMREAKEEESPTKEAGSPAADNSLAVMMMGRSGLLNIGNTCYMNTGLQVWLLLMFALFLVSVSYS